MRRFANTAESRMKAAKYLGWRHMTAAQRHNARQDRIWADFDARRKADLTLTTRFNPSSRVEPANSTLAREVK